MVTVQLQLKTVCIQLLTPAIEVIYYGDYRKCFFKVQHFFNLSSRLPLVQGSITSSKYFVINSTGNGSIRL